MAGDRPGEEIDVFCYSCNRIAIARVHAGVCPTYELRQLREDEPDSMHQCVAYKIAFCVRCEDVFFVKSAWSEVPGEFASDPEHSVLYPRNTEPLPEEVPEIVRRPFENAVRCYAAGAYDPAAIMCRKSLEALCLALEASGGSLKAKIDHLSQEGKIDPRLAQWADELRLVGNDAAHDLAVEITQEDAEDGIAFVEAIIQNLFVLSKRFEELSLRRMLK